jgi:hypothetical protein
MPFSEHRLLACIEPGEQEFKAAFVSAAASRRAPATRRCRSPDEGKQWVEREAEKLGVPVEWTDRLPSPR